MTKKIEKISKEDLNPVITARSKNIELAQKAESVLKEAKVADLEYRVAVQDLYLSKGIPSSAQIDLNTGDVKYQDEVKEEAKPEGTTKKTSKKAAKKVVKKA